MNNYGQTYINVYRSLLQWEWYKDTSTKVLFLHCLLRANHKPRSWQGIKLKQGEFITSLDHLAHETGLSIQNIRTSLKKLKMTNEITTVTTNRYTKINVTKYSLYQNGKIETNKQNNKELTNNQQTTNKQLTTDNKDNKDNKDNNIIIRVIEYFNTACNMKYKKTDKSFQTYIKSLLKDGYTEKDLKTVIDKKSKQWLGTEQEQYLTFRTLFNGSKFSTYLNQKITEPPPDDKTDTFSDFKQRIDEYTPEELDRLARRKFNSETAEGLDD